MTSSADAAADQVQGAMEGLAKAWWLILLMGILSIAIGVMAIVWPGKTLLVVAIFFAAWLFVSGIFSVVNAFTRDEDAGARVLNAIIGVLSVIVGFALLRAPFQSLEVMIFALGIFWIAQGIVGFVVAFQSKAHRGWRLFSAIIGILAGIVILQYPISSAEILALFGGIWLIVLGAMQVFGAFQVKGAAAASGPATA